MRASGRRWTGHGCPFASGALPLETKGIINQISMAVPSYWATNALSASVDIVQLNLTSDPDLQDRWVSTASNATNSLAVVGLFGLLFMVPVSEATRNGVIRFHTVALKRGVLA